MTELPPEEIDVFAPQEAVSQMLDHAADHKDNPCLTLGQLIDDFGRVSFQPILMLLGLSLVSPLSGVPVFSSIIGLSIAVVAIQGAAGRPVIWLPAFLMNRGIEGRRAAAAVERLRGFGRWLDRRTKRRIDFVTGPICGRLLMGLAAVVGVMTPMLELIPLSSSLVGLGTVLIALALLVRDGLLAIVGVGTYMIAAAIPATVLTTVAA